MLDFAPMQPRLVPILLCAALVGCRNPPIESDDPVEPDPDAAPIEVPEDNVANAIGDCLGYYREPEEYPNQLAAGSELSRYTLADPEAVCNDGTRAVMYVRAATSEALANVWSIHLQGGGGCGSYLSCALRWCGLDYYDSSKMSSRDLPLNIAGFGVYDDADANQLAGANQVFFYYCSSDAWRGQGSGAYDPGDLEIPEDLPAGVEVPDELPSYTMFRRGHTILASGLDELQEGLIAQDGEALPPLDDAEIVLLNGTSGGSNGGRANADYVRARLSAHGTDVLAVFDAAHVPLAAHLPGPYGSALDAYKEQAWQQSLDTEDLPFMDETCWDAWGGTADEQRCYDDDYVMMNHITTPFFVRQDLRDIGGASEVIGLPEDEHEAAVVAMFGALADIQSTAVEGAEIAVAPGAYGPNCSQHVALESTQWWALAAVDDGFGTEWSFQQAVIAWYQGDAVAIVDEPLIGSGDGPRSRCEDVDDEH